MAKPAALFLNLVLVLALFLLFIAMAEGRLSFGCEFNYSENFRHINVL